MAAPSCSLPLPSIRYWYAPSLLPDGLLYICVHDELPLYPLILLSFWICNTCCIFATLCLCNNWLLFLVLVCPAGMSWFCFIPSVIYTFRQFSVPCWWLFGCPSVFAYICTYNLWCKQKHMNMASGNQEDHKSAEAAASHDILLALRLSFLVTSLW